MLGLYFAMRRVLWAFLTFSLFCFSAAAASQVNGEDKDLEGLRQIEAQRAEQVRALNQINPISEEFASGTIDPSRLPPKLRWVASASSLLGDPRVKKLTAKIVALISNERFQKNSKKIAENPLLKW